MTDLEKQLRVAIRDSDLTTYRLATEAGVSRGVMSRFLAAERGINLDTAGRLAAVLGFELQSVRKPRKR